MCVPLSFCSAGHLGESSCFRGGASPSLTAHTGDNMVMSLGVRDSAGDDCAAGEVPAGANGAEGERAARAHPHVFQALPGGAAHDHLGRCAHAATILRLQALYSWGPHLPCAAANVVRPAMQLQHLAGFLLPMPIPSASPEPHLAILICQVVLAFIWHSLRFMNRTFRGQVTAPSGVHFQVSGVKVMYSSWTGAECATAWAPCWPIVPGCREALASNERSDACFSSTPSLLAGNAPFTHTASHSIIPWAQGALGRR